MAILWMLWFRVCLWCAWWSSFGLPLVWATTCLQDGIPEDQRQNITIDGVSMPLGLAMGNWDSAQLVTSVYQILASEVQKPLRGAGWLPDRSTNLDHLKFVSPRISLIHHSLLTK